MEDAEREAKIRELAEAYAERLRQAWPVGEADLTRIEELAEHIGSTTNRELTEELVRKQAEQELVRETACPECGGVTHFKGRYEQEVVTAQGRVRVARAYYHCAACGKGSCPLDQRWGLGPANTTPTVQARTAVLAVWIPYTRLPEVTRQLRLTWQLDVKSSEAITQRVGEAVRQAPPVGCGPAQRPVAVAVDGVFLLTRDEGWKEARCAVVYEPDFDVGRRPDECAGLRKEYLGGLVDRETVLTRACARAVARQLPGVPIAALGDGAHWIWEGYARALPERVEILDFYHACQHLARVAQARHPGDPETATQWLAEQRHELRHLGPRRLLRELATWEPQGKGSVAARKVRDDEGGYFTRNQERMQYPRYAQEGLPIGSGAVEGACKHLVAARFKQAGMRWGRATAEPLIHLRAALLSQPGIDLRRYAGAAMVN
jgi:hypothetical protein